MSWDLNDYFMMTWDDIISGYPVEGFVVDMVINYVFLQGVLVDLQTELCWIFDKFSSDSLFLNIKFSYKSLSIRFSNGFSYWHVLRLLGRCSRKPGLTQEHATVVTCSISGLGRDNTLVNSNIKFFRLCRWLW